MKGFVLIAILMLAAAARGDEPICDLLHQEAPACKSSVPSPSMDQVNKFVCALDKPVDAIHATEESYQKCPKYKFKAKPFNMGLKSPAPSKIGDRDFPQNYRLMYRGTGWGNPGTQPTMALAAMLGDESAYFGSHAFTEIHDILLRKKALDSSKLMPRFVEYGIVDDLKYLTNCSTFDEREARILAADLMDKAFFSLQSKNVIEPRFLNEKSGQFVEWPAELVYSSVYQAITQYYGGQTLVIKNTRSLDKHYWELKNSGKPLDSHSACDSGEFVTAGYIAPSDIQGYWVREHDVTFGVAASTDKAWTNGVSWAFQKLERDGHTYVLVFDAKGARCVENGGDDRYYFCKRNYGAEMKSGDLSRIIPWPTVEKDKELALAGVIALCKPKAECKRPDEIFARYPKSEKAIPDYYRNQLANMRLTHGSAVLYLQDSAKAAAVSKAPPCDCPFDPKLVKRGNATKKLVEACDGRSACTYDVSEKTLGSPFPGLSKGIRVKWHCSKAPQKTETSELADSEGKQLYFLCGDKGVVKITEATYAYNIKADSKGKAVPENLPPPQPVSPPPVSYVWRLGHDVAKNNDMRTLCYETDIKGNIMHSGNPIEEKFCPAPKPDLAKEKKDK